MGTKHKNADAEILQLFIFEMQADTVNNNPIQIANIYNVEHIISHLYITMATIAYAGYRMWLFTPKYTQYIYPFNLYRIAEPASILRHRQVIITCKQGGVFKG